MAMPDYGHAHRKERARLARLLETRGTMQCARCGQPINLGDQWDLGHRDDDPTQWAGPEHRNQCNRAAGGRTGRRNDRLRRIRTNNW